MVPHHETGELDLRGYLVVLRRRAPLIVLATVAVLVSALVVSFLQTPLYQGTTEVLLQPRTSEQLFALDRPQSGQVSNQVRVETEIEVMRSRSVRDAVAEALPEADPPVELAADTEVEDLPVTIAVVGQTDVVRISALSPDPAEAASIADTYADAYVDLRRSERIDDLLAAAEQVQARVERLDEELTGVDAPLDEIDARIDAATTDDEREDLRIERDRIVEDVAATRQPLLTQRAAFTQQLDELQLSSGVTQEGGARIVSRAEVPEEPVRPTPLRNAALALVVGALLGVGIAFLVEYLDDTVATKDDLERATDGLTPLALVPLVPGWKDRERSYLVSMEEPSSPAAETYRSLRTSVQFLGLDQPLRLIQFTSANPAEGKSATLANLAVTLARADLRVAVVCCDLRRPRIHEFFGLDNAVGFTSVLLGNSSIKDALQRVPGLANLALLASGPPPPNPSELLSSARARDTFESLAGAFDVVLIDTPPVLPVADPLVVSRMVDATIFVATSKRSTRKDTRRAVEVLRQVDAPLVGAVLNGVEGEALYGYGGYRYGGYRAYGTTGTYGVPVDVPLDVDATTRRSGPAEPDDIEVVHVDAGDAGRPRTYPGSRR